VIEAIVAFLIGGIAMMFKARASQSSIFSAPGRRFVLAFAPSLIAGAFITFVLYRDAHFQLLPGVWLLLYGTAVVGGGALSVRVVPIMGMLFMLSGAMALFVPLHVGNLFMAAGFGLLQIITGLVIARHYGG
jgi:hypothetical protein